ncbi:MAG: aspartate aminotransferase family protein [Arenicellales bacterium WSBS_2016_MAG_OTU3]
MNDLSEKLQSRTQQLLEKGKAYYVPNYAPRELIIDHAKGSHVWDIEGNEYIDLGSGISVNSLGHQHPALMQALEQQLKKIWHTSNIYITEPPIHLAQELVDASFAERVYFCNSGAEANEAAIKIARKYSSLYYPEDKREIITFQGSFHGRTLATVTATAQPKYHEGFEPLPGGFSYCAFNDENAITAAVSDKTCAIMLEPVQGEGGVTPAKAGFLKHVRALCDKHNALLILDEIQCGMGRTGKLFTHEWEDVKPDVMTLAKALGCGLPIGAMLTTEEVAKALKVGTHGSTFGGNPVMCALARVALKEISSPELLAHVSKQGDYFVKRLNDINANLGVFKEVRGKGLMIGGELVEELSGKAGCITEVCRSVGVLILQAGPNVLRFLPPLNINDEDLREGLDRLEKGLAKFAVKK